MFKNAILYRIAGLPVCDLSAVAERAQAHVFAPCEPTQPASMGWTPPRGDKHGALLEVIGGQLILRLTRESRTVPSAAIKQELTKRLEKIEADTGRRPKGKAAKDIKAEVTHELMPRAFPKRSCMPVWVSPAHNLVVVGAGSIKASDQAASLLVELLGGGVALSLVQTAASPVKAMANWLLDQEAPSGFTIDRECELKQPDSEKAGVRYTRHTLDIAEVAQHIQQGKQPTQLAMTWKSRVSFVLTEAMVLKRITLLDVALEGQGDNASGFDADVAISTGELSAMVADLIEAIGGEAEPDLVGKAAEEAEAPAPHTGEGPDPMLSMAREIVIAHQRSSISLVQRHLRIGYNRAARLLEQLEKEGVLGAMRSDGGRDILAAA